MDEEAADRVPRPRLRRHIARQRALPLRDENNLMGGEFTQRFVVRAGLVAPSAFALWR